MAGSTLARGEPYTMLETKGSFVRLITERTGAESR